MVSYTFVAAVALVALVGGARADATKCASARYGNLAGVEQQLSDAPLPPGYQAYNFKIQPQPCSSASYTHVGTVVVACDDATPTVWLNDLLTGQVQRHGNYLQNTGFLRFFVYCQP